MLQLHSGDMVTVKSSKLLHNKHNYMRANFTLVSLEQKLLKDVVSFSSFFSRNTKSRSIELTQLRHCVFSYSHHISMHLTHFLDQSPY